MEHRKSGTLPRGDEVILLVEPDPEARTLAVFMLSKQGYHVIEARNAMEAMKLYDEHGPGIDLLFTEALMSRVNGHDLAQMLQGRDPELRVLYLADADYEKMIRRLAAQKGISFLPRPFTMGMLAAKVRQVLDAPVSVAVMTVGRA
jgi:two-component system cell cycle sensor histidine kinase/response regulator CckA